jgi:outer membrane receptor for ferrienterochelin and colicins
MKTKKYISKRSVNQTGKGRNVRLLEKCGINLIETRNRKERKMKTKKYISERSVNQTLIFSILVTLGMLFINAQLFAEEPNTAKSTNEQRLNEITSQLDTMNAQRQRLLEEKENLQIMLWGKVPEGEKANEFEDMSIVDLMSVEVSPVGTLTKTESPRYVPSAVTTITKEQIQISGAHSLNELLEIYVPNLQYAIQHWEAPHLGARGIINDRDDKYLMLVNGKVMNERTHYGALSERDLPMMRDIDHIDVVRGPGSAIYGPGAVSMVINIVTDNGLTFQGTEVMVKGGAIEKFGSLEVRHGRAISKDSAFYIYAGVDKYYGATGDDAPWIFENSFPAKTKSDFPNQWEWDSYGPLTRITGQHAQDYQVEKGEPVPFDYAKDNASYKDLPRAKFHVQYNKGDFEAWARYSSGGQNYTNPPGAVNYNGALWFNTKTYYPPVQWTNAAGDLIQSGTAYDQFTMYGGYKQDISETFNIHYNLSYDSLYFERRDWANATQEHGENKLYGKVLATWTPNDKHSVAFGGETSYESWGTRGLTQYNPDGILRNHWFTQTYSAMGEWQWSICDWLRTFVGGRVDKNTYTDPMYSPRFALVLTPTEKDTIKASITRSVRMNNAEEMRWEYVNNDEMSQPEKLDNYELRYERQQNENLWFAATAFINKLNVISWDTSAHATKNVGGQKVWGLEGEITYKKDNLELSASHGYTELIHFTLQSGASTYLSAMPYGYGEDLANWHNHISKIQAKYTINPKWSVNASARLYWGVPGAKDYAKYQATVAGNTEAPDMSSYDASKPAYFVNIGAEYKYSDNLTVRLDGCNLMGFLDEKYNKRLYTQDTFNDYRCTAPSFIVSLIYKF